jgi:quercetin dioxygenase-like cupin family protein
MKNLYKKTISALVFASFCVSSLSFSALATPPVVEKSDTIKRAQAKREIILENEQVQVVRLTYPIGTESGMHTHIFANRVVYFIQGGKLSLIPQDTNKASKTLIATDGQTLYLPAITHNVRNIGNTEIVIIKTELK